MITGSVAAALLIATVVVMRAVLRHRRRSAAGMRMSHLGSVSEHWLLARNGEDR